jgi:hypothetical protein
MKKLIFFILTLLSLNSYSQTFTIPIYITDSLYISKFFKTSLPQNGYKNFYFMIYGPYTAIPFLDFRCYTLLRYNYVTGVFQNDFHNSKMNRTYDYSIIGGFSFGYVIDFDFAKTDTNQFLYSYQSAWWEPMVGVFHSTNNGVTTIQNPFPFMAGSSYGISINPIDKDIMYYIYPMTYINKTTNKGVNWFVTDTVTEMNTNSIMRVNPFNTNTVFLSKTNGLKRSTNGGYDFQDVNINPVNITRFIFDNSDNSIYVTASTNNAGILKSTNNGTNWSVIFNFICYDMEIDPLNSNIFYAGTQNGIYKTTNRGQNWIIYNNTFTPSKYVYGIVKNPNSGDTLFVVTQKKVYKVFGQSVVGVPQSSEIIPTQYELYQNYPNPFNPKTNIRYAIPKNSFVKLIVFDALGRKVETLINEKQNAGIYETAFDASPYPSGVYFYRLDTDGFSDVKKMILVK